MSTQNNEPDFDIRILFDEEGGYEDFVAEIYYKDSFVCLISQENGLANLNIEIHPRVDGQPWRFDLSAFEAAIAYATKRLWELRKS